MQVEVSVPSSLREVKLKDYQELLIKENPDNDDMLKCILNINTKELGKIKDKDVDNLLSIINKLFDKKHEFIPTFKMKGVLYGFIPKLDDITYGENKDVTNYINDWGNMHKAMAVLYRPIKEEYKDKYTLKEYDGVHYAEILKNMPTSVAVSCLVFFYALGKELLVAIPKYLEQQLKKEDMQQLEMHLEKSGVGINQFTHSLKEILRDLKVLPN